MKLVSSIAQPEDHTDRYMADWTAEAACRGDQRPSRLGLPGGFAAGEVWDDAYMDEVEQLNDATIWTHTWSDTVLWVLEVCASCPVRERCLSDAYAEEQAISQLWWSAELVEEDRRFGIRGGVPGRVREVYADDPDQVAKSEAWVAWFHERYGWAPSRQPRSPDADATISA